MVFPIAGVLAVAPALPDVYPLPNRVLTVKPGKQSALGPLSVNLNSNVVSGTLVGSGAATTTPVTTSSPAPSAPGTVFTYSWSPFSGDGAISVSNPSAAAVTFSGFVDSAGVAARTAVWRVLVVNSDGRSAFDFVTVNLTATTPPPPPTAPNWDFSSDSPQSVPGGGTATIHWGINLISFDVGPCTASPAFSGSFAVTVAPGGYASGTFFGSVTDTGNGTSSSGAFSWEVFG